MRFDGDLIDLLAGDSLDDYAYAHQKVMDVASQVPIASSFVPIVNAIWEPLTGKAGTAAEQRQRDADAAQKQAADAAAAALYPQMQAAREQAASAAGTRRLADQAARDADAAAKAARSEPNPRGPLHAKAARAAAYARLMMASASGEDEKASALQSLVPSSSTPTQPTAKPSWWRAHSRTIWIVGAGVAGAGVLALIASAARSRK